MGKLVLVTGATGDLGLALCERLLAADYSVAAGVRRSNAALEALAAGYAARCHIVTLDLAHPNRIRGSVSQITGRYGALYGLVNNAAVAHDGLLLTMPDEQIAETYGVNLVAATLLAKYAARAMVRAGGGRIVNVASVAGVTALRGLAAYGAAKAGLLLLTRALARELGPVGITANAVVPGFMQTRMTADLQESVLAGVVRRTPLGQMVAVGDVADAVLYLLSPSAAHITGAAWTIDGGFSA